MAAPPDPLLLAKYRALAQLLRDEPGRSEIEGIARDVLLRDLRTLGTQLNLPASLTQQGEEQAFLNTLIPTIDRAIEESRTPIVETPEGPVGESKEREEPSHRPLGPTGRVQKEEEQEKKEQAQRPSRRPSFRSVQRGLQRTRSIARRGSSVFRRYAPRTTRAFLSPLPRAASTLLNIPRITIGGILRGMGNIVGGFLRQLAFGAARAVVTGAGALVGSFGWVPIVVIVVVLLLTLFVILLTGATFPPGGTGTGGGADVSSCTFYRAGDSIQGLRIGNPQMASLITDVSNRVGVPPAIIAGIMRVETASALASTDPTYVTNDYDAHCSGVSNQSECALRGIAFGVMQFTPSTFLSTFDRNRGEMGTLFGKTDARTIIDPQSNMYPASYLRIYSVRDSIIAASFKVRDDKRAINGNGPWDQATVYEIATRYYGCLLYPSCSSGPYNYGEDLWRSYSNCLATTTTPTIAPIAATSCPLQGTRTIGCGSFMSDPRFNRGICAGPEPIDRGHCGRNYGSCFQGTIDATNNLRRAHSIDVDAPAGETVYLPTINNQVVQWAYYPSLSYGVAPSDGGGFGHVFIASVGTDRWFLHLVHTNPPPLIPTPAGRSYYQSGDAVTTIAQTSYTHLHINIGMNPEGANSGRGWLNPEGLGMCVQ